MLSGGHLASPPARHPAAQPPQALLSGPQTPLPFPAPVTAPRPCPPPCQTPTQPSRGSPKDTSPGEPPPPDSKLHRPWGASILKPSQAGWEAQAQLACIWNGGGGQGAGGAARWVQDLPPSPAQKTACFPVSQPSQRMCSFRTCTHVQNASQLLTHARTQGHSQVHRSCCLSHAHSGPRSHTLTCSHSHAHRGAFLPLAADAAEAEPEPGRLFPLALPLGVLGALDLLPHSRP